MKSNIKREDLKNNFLKKVIMRIDYSGIAEVELDNIVAEIKSVFKIYGYNKLKEEYLTEMDFELQDPENMEMEGLPVREIRRKRAYVFVNEEKGIKCKVSAHFTSVSVQNQKYISFSEYSETLISVMKTLKTKWNF